MTELTREDVLKIARLSRLSLTEAEAEEHSKELSKILQYVAQLNKVDTSGLEPTVQVTGLVNVMRDDQPVDYGVSPEDLLNLAPQREDGQVKVKRMIA